MCTHLAGVDRGVPLAREKPHAISRARARDRPCSPCSLVSFALPPRRSDEFRLAGIVGFLIGEPLSRALIASDFAGWRAGVFECRFRRIRWMFDGWIDFFLAIHGKPRHCAIIGASLAVNRSRCFPRDGGRNSISICRCSVAAGIRCNAVIAIVDRSRVRAAR